MIPSLSTIPSCSLTCSASISLILMRTTILSSPRSYTTNKYILLLLPSFLVLLECSLPPPSCSSLHSCLYSALVPFLGFALLPSSSTGHDPSHDPTSILYILYPERRYYQVVFATLTSVYLFTVLSTSFLFGLCFHPIHTEYTYILLLFFGIFSLFVH